MAVAVVLALWPAGAEGAPVHLTNATEYTGGKFPPGLDRFHIPTGTSLISMSEDEFNNRIAVKASLRTRCGFAVFTRHTYASPDGRIELRGRARRPFPRRSYRYRLVGQLGPGGGSGTLSATVTVRRGHRTRRCRGRSLWRIGPVVRPSEPYHYSMPAPGALYAGFSDKPFRKPGVEPREPVMLRISRNGRYLRAIFRLKSSCRLGLIREYPELHNVTPLIAVRSDGSFRSVERFRVVFADVVARAKVRFSGRFIENQVQGSWSATESYRDRRTGRHIETCGSYSYDSEADPSTRWYAQLLR